MKADIESVYLKLLSCIYRLVVWNCMRVLLGPPPEKTRAKMSYQVVSSLHGLKLTVYIELIILTMSIQALKITVSTQDLNLTVCLETLNRMVSI